LRKWQKKCLIVVISSHGYILESDYSMKFIDWESDITGFEKQIYLNWSPSQFAKTVYFSKGALIYGVVLPMDEKVILKDISDYLQLTKSKAKSMAISNLLPYGQMRHSAGPFISKKDIEGFD